MPLRRYPAARVPTSSLSLDVSVPQSTIPYYSLLYRSAPLNPSLFAIGIVGDGALLRLRSFRTRCAPLRVSP